MISVCVRKKLMTPTGVMTLEADFTVEHGEFVTLFGKSGAGKTTILRMIAGLTAPDEGVIIVDGKVWFDHQKKINLNVQKRDIGFVFQENTLFAHMSVRANLEFALANKKEKSRVDEMLELVDLRGLSERKPNQLSGGEKQRVAFLRAFMRKPKIFLLDEPFASLDIAMRLKLQDEMTCLYKKFDATVILVSHDLSEVFKLSNRVLVLDEGRIVKSGEPSRIFASGHVSGKFKFVGEIIAIKRAGIVNILTVLIGNQGTQVVSTDEEIKDLKVGDKILVVVKAFNPIIMKL